MPIADAISLLVAALGDVPLIGFAGAPFTLASYLVEGGPSRNHERTKAMMLGEPATWHALMSTLTDITIEFLGTQVDAGVDAIQLFDSWAGTLSLADYREYVLPHSSRVFEALSRPRCADDPLRSGYRRTPRRDVRCHSRRRVRRRRCRLADVAAERPSPESGPVSHCRAISTRWCCWRAGPRSTARCAPSWPTVVAPSLRARRATCSTSVTACCLPPIRPS